MANLAETFPQFKGTKTARGVQMRVANALLALGDFPFFIAQRKDGTWIAVAVLVEKRMQLAIPLVNRGICVTDARA